MTDRISEGIGARARRYAGIVLAPFLAFKRRFPLWAFILRRIAITATMLFVLGFLVFALMAAVPGDIVTQMVIQQLMAGGLDGDMGAASSATSMNGLTNDQFEELRARLGLDQPFFVQYFRWLGRVLHGDLGVSLVSRAPVSFIMWERMMNSLLLNTISLVIITTISFGLGVYFSSKAGTRQDVVVTFVALFLHATPTLIILLLLQLFAFVTGLFPIRGFPPFPFHENPGAFVFSYMHHIFLLVLGSFLGGIGGSLRTTRALMLDQLGQPYITSLRVRGIAEWRVYLLHAFRNTLNPFITGTATLLAGLFAGSVILEIIFAFPGVGRLIYEAVMQQDINLVMANLMFTSTLVMVGMALADILLAVADPRIRYGKE